MNLNIIHKMLHFFYVLLIIHINNDTKIVSVIIVIETHTKKFNEIFQKKQH